MKRLALLVAAMLLVFAGKAELPACRAIMQPAGPPAARCASDNRVRIAAVGDVLLHRPLQQRGYSDANGFRSLWRSVEPIFRAADIAYANLEGPVAPGLRRGAYSIADPGPVFDDRVYTSFPLFNYHPIVIRDLIASGISLVSTANNHAMDRRSSGADLTIEQLRLAGLDYMGTIKAGARRNFVHRSETRLGRIAWIACSYSTNGLPDPKRQVLLCQDDSEELLKLISREARRADVAGVIVTPHWGNEYRHSPSQYQIERARAMAAAGALVIIGTHPHVVQPWDWVDDKRGRRTLVIFSTGNFVSGQSGFSRRVGALAWLELCKAPPDGELRVSSASKLNIARAGWVPMLMVRSAKGPEVRAIPTKASGVGRDAYELLARHLPPSGIHYRLACLARNRPLLKLQ